MIEYRTLKQLGNDREAPGKEWPFMKKLLWVVLPILAIGKTGMADTASPNQWLERKIVHLNSDWTYDTVEFRELNYRDRFEIRLGNNLYEKSWSRYRLRWRRPFGHHLGESYYGTDEWEDTEDDSYDFLLTWMRRSAEDTIRESNWAKQFDEDAKEWKENLESSDNGFQRWIGQLTPFVKLYYQPKTWDDDEGMTLDVGYRSKEFDYGFRVKGRPGVFVSYKLPQKPLASRTKFDLAYYPASEFVEGRVSSSLADLSLKWYYQDDNRLRLEIRDIGFIPWDSLMIRHNILIEGGLGYQYTPNGEKNGNDLHQFLLTCAISWN